MFRMELPAPSACAASWMRGWRSSRSLRNSTRVSGLAIKCSITDAAFDSRSRIGPAKRAAVLIPADQPARAGFLRPAHAAEIAVLDGLFGDQGKSALDNVDPVGGGQNVKVAFVAARMERVAAARDRRSACDRQSRYAGFSTCGVSIKQPDVPGVPAIAGRHPFPEPAALIRANRDGCRA